MAKLLISPEAKQDLLEIKEYISNELDSPIAAKNVTDKIIKQISKEILEGNIDLKPY